MNPIIFFFLLPVLLCTGCDSLRRINMKNNTADTVQITWHTVKDSIGFNPFVLNNSDELKFTIPPGANNDIKLSFGSGNWTQENVQHLMKYLLSLEIQSPKKQTTFSTPKEISEFLWAHRKGVGSKRIEITVAE